MREFRQVLEREDSINYSIKEVLAEGKTTYQEYLFFDSALHGRCLVLDGDLQSCERDEALYHEALVHPAMLLHPNPKTVLVMGGGEGATVREVLKHKSVERVVMVDIDEEFVALCKHYIASWGATAFNDPRLELHHRDINEYLANCSEQFDVVIGDLIDVSDWESDVAALYGSSLYRRLKAQMSSKGIISTQAGTLDMQKLKNHKKIRAVLTENFSDVKSYGLMIPSFYALWGFVIAGDSLEICDIQECFKRDESLFEALGSSALLSTFSLPKVIKTEIGV